jgi:hypothetical protein
VNTFLLLRDLARTTLFSTFNRLGKDTAFFHCKKTWQGQHFFLLLQDLARTTFFTLKIFQTKKRQKNDIEIFQTKKRQKMTLKFFK